MSKRILSLVLTLTLVLGSFSMAFADHADTALTTEQKIEYLKQNGFIKGNESGDDMLDVEIDRASVATIIARTLLSGTDGDVETEIAKSNYVGPFKDVPQSHWGNAAINVAVENQITNGTGKGEFSPARNITYIEVIAMMNRILGNEVEAGIDWNVAKSRNIALAREAGILDGINMNNFNYDDVAIRGVIFELLYNTVTNFEVGQYQIDKVIVLENNRVESIGENEIVVEVIEEVQRANFIKENADKRRGKQLRISIPSDVEIDTEDMLGKVVDLSYDGTNKAVRAQLDKTYEYKFGPMELEENKLTVDEKSYTVLKGDQYESDDERIFSTYVNNEAFAYKDALKVRKSIDFGKATIKNGKVLFIDAFAFDDIAPVKSVKEDGKKTEVTVYNDLNDGGNKRISLEKEKVVSFEEGSFHQIDKKDIKELDVIHVGEDTKGNKVVVVRQDSQVNGTYEKVVEYKSKTVVVIDGEEYEILNVDAKRPVYSYDSEEFRTLNANEAANVLKEFKDEKATILQDVNGDLQYLGSEIEFGEFVGLVDRVVGKEARLLKSDNSKSDYATTLDSDLGDASTGHQNLQSYKKGDVVFVAADKAEIEAMDVLSKVANNDTESKEVEKISSLNFIKEVNGAEYRVLDRTNVFVRTLKDGNVDEMYATDYENIKDNAKDGVALKAIVITDEDYNKVDPRRPFDDSKSPELVANTIVFTEIEIEKDLNEEIVEITNISNKYETIRVEFANGDKKTFDIDKDSSAYDMLKDTKDVKTGNIVKLGIDKDNDKLVKTIKVLINEDNNVYEVSYYNQRTKEMILTGLGSVYLTNDTENFIKSGIREGDFIAVDKKVESRDSKYIEAIAGRTEKDFTGNVVESDGKLKSVLELDGKIVLVIDENGKDTTYEYAGDKSYADSLAYARGLEGQKVTFDKGNVNNVNFVYNLEAVTEKPATKADLIQAIVDAKAVDTTGKTQASIDALNNAITAAEQVRDNSNATQAQIDAAVTNVNDAVDGLVNIGEVTINASDVDVKMGAAPKLIAVKVKFPAGVTNVKITKVGDFVLPNAESLTDDYYANVPGNLGDSVEFTFDANGTTETVTITK